MGRSSNNPLPELRINTSTAHRDSDLSKDTCTEVSEEGEAAGVGFALAMIRNLARVQETRVSIGAGLGGIHQITSCAGVLWNSVPHKRQSSRDGLLLSGVFS
jgi:hypothetical protein